MTSDSNSISALDHLYYCLQHYWKAFQRHSSNQLEMYVNFRMVTKATFSIFRTEIPSKAKTALFSRKGASSSAEFSIWYEGHKSECDINHLGSSTSMEMEAALTLWKRSTSLDSVILQYYPMVIVKTFNYFKRLGTALRSTVKDCRAQGISLGGKAHGSLKEAND
ncbi:uncharacterized protein TNCV_247481 [Trichonephila clavipes]|nr:uncharacterized protein TNCV_247481 [Trichonephila clavipes]